MPESSHHRHSNALASDERRLTRLFGHTELLPMWIAEPYVELSPDIRQAIEVRARSGWYGYETRPDSVVEAFWGWMKARHGWDGADLTTLISPSVGTSIGVLIEELTSEGDGVILQPPVFTDFKPLVVSAHRTVTKNPLVLTDDGYRMDLEGLAEVASAPSTRLMILTNPHNPVGRLWSPEELTSVAEICAANDVVVISDEIHADLALGSRVFTPFSVAASGTGVTWAATHGPIKTFGLAGVCDTLLITDSEGLAATFRAANRRLHLTRTNVFSTAAFETAYQLGGEWLDALLVSVADNAAMLEAGLVDEIDVVPPEATYLAWLDFRALDLEVPELAKWLADSGLALSPGHWFGREGAGFARMTIAVDEREVAEALERLNRAAAGT